MSLLRSLAIGAMIPFVPLFIIIMPSWYWRIMGVLIVATLVHQMIEARK